MAVDVGSQDALATTGPDGTASVTMPPLGQAPGGYNAVASFVLIAAVAVYYIVETTPASPGPGDSADDQPMP